MIATPIRYFQQRHRILHLLPQQWRFLRFNKRKLSKITCLKIKHESERKRRAFSENAVNERGDVLSFSIRKLKLLSHEIDFEIHICFKIIRFHHNLVLIEMRR